MSGYMDPSPKGRAIATVDGQPGDIIARGQQIESLGQKMLTSADTLQRVKENSFDGGGQHGKSVEALQDKIGDSYKTLKQAGELYHPVGPVITKYGQALEHCKPQIDRSVESCEDLWAAYDALPGDKDGSTTPEAGGGFLGIGGHDADSPEAKQDAEDNQAKKQAYDAWHDEAEQFDTWYDAWEDAFDEASSGIDDKMAGTIKDGFWEAFDDFLDALGDVALVLSIVAICLTGPFAAIALALSAVVLAGKLLEAATNHGSWSDVAWAALAILPFGKGGRMLSSSMKGFEYGSALGGRLGDALSSRAAQFGGKMAGGAEGFGKAFGRSFKQSFDFSQKLGIKSVSDMGLSALTGKTADEIGKALPAGKPMLPGVWETAHGTVGQMLGYVGAGYKIAGWTTDDAPDNPLDHSVLDVPW